MARSDLNIFCYASNTLLESLYFKADSLILEPNFINNLNIKEFSSYEINFHRNLESLKKAINYKLSKNKFYYHDKAELVNKYFADVSKYKTFLKIFN